MGLGRNVLSTRYQRLLPLQLSRGQILLERPLALQLRRLARGLKVPLETMSPRQLPRFINAVCPSKVLTPAGPVTARSWVA